LSRRRNNDPIRKLPNNVLGFVLKSPTPTTATNGPDEDNLVYKQPKGGFSTFRSRSRSQRQHNPPRRR